MAPFVDDFGHVRPRGALVAMLGTPLSLGGKTDHADVDLAAANKGVVVATHTVAAGGALFGIFGTECKPIEAREGVLFAGDIFAQLVHGHQAGAARSPAPQAGAAQDLGRAQVYKGKPVERLGDEARRRDVVAFALVVYP